MGRPIAPSGTDSGERASGETARREREPDRLRARLDGAPGTRGAVRGAGDLGGASAGRCTTHATRSGRLLFNVLGVVAKFEADLIRQRTREGLRVAAAKGRPPKLSPARERHLVELHDERREDGGRKYTA